jgi:prepilin-type N-terminal cleavage/methylation domain-containing protein
MSRPARRRRREDGFTLVEIMVTSSLMLVLLAMVLPQLTSSLNVFSNAQVRSNTTDQAQLALEQIQHDVLSSNILYLDNTLANGAGVVHLQSFGPGGAATCVEYQATTATVGARGSVVGGALQRRTKAPSASWPAAGTGWSTVMTGIVNSTQTPIPAVFANSVASQYRSLVVTLWVNSDTRVGPTAAPAMYTTTVTGRAIPANPSSTSGPC